MSWRELPFAPVPGTEVCGVSQLPDGGGREFVFGDGEDAFRLLLLRRGEEVWGYRNRCPHFSLPLNFEPQNFLTFDEEVVCAHHTAFFRFSDGVCTDGPCKGVGLDPVSVQVDGGRVWIAGDRKV